MSYPPNRQGQQPIWPDRVRSISGNGFAFVPNGFLHGGFFASLNGDELILYFLLVLAGDRNGMSFYHYDSLCSVAAMTIEQYVQARNALIDKDLIAFDGRRFQVLSLPAEPTRQLALQSVEQLEEQDPATIRLLVKDCLGGHEE